MRHNTSFRPVNTKPDSAVITLRLLPWSFVKPKKYQKPLHNFWDDLQHNLQRQIWTNKMRLWSFSSRTVAQMLMVDITKFDYREKKFMKSSDFYNLWALYIHLLSAKWFAVWSDSYHLCRQKYWQTVKKHFFLLKRNCNKKWKKIEKDNKPTSRLCIFFAMNSCSNLWKFKFHSKADSLFITNTPQWLRLYFQKKILLNCPVVALFELFLLV